MVVKCLEVTVGSTAGLKENRASTRNDPFAVVRLGGVEYRTDAGRGATSRVVWNHRYSFLLPDDEDVPKEELEVDIWDHQENNSDKFIGSCKVNLTNVYRKGTADVVQPVHRRSGKLLGHIRFHLSLLIEDINRTSRDSESPPPLPPLPQANRLPAPSPVLRAAPVKPQALWAVKAEPSHWQSLENQMRMDLQTGSMNIQQQQQQHQQQQEQQSSAVDLWKQIQQALQEAQIFQLQQAAMQSQEHQQHQQHHQHQQHMQHQQHHQHQQQVEQAHHEQQRQAAAHALYHQLPLLQRKTVQTNSNKSMLPPLPRPIASHAFLQLKPTESKPLPPLAPQALSIPVQMKKMPKPPPLDLTAVPSQPPPSLLPSALTNSPASESPSAIFPSPSFTSIISPAMWSPLTKTPAGTSSLFSPTSPFFHSFSTGMKGMQVSKETEDLGNLFSPICNFKDSAFPPTTNLDMSAFASMTSSGLLSSKGGAGEGGGTYVFPSQEAIAEALSLACWGGGGPVGEGGTGPSIEPPSAPTITKPTAAIPPTPTSPDMLALSSPEKSSEVNIGSRNSAFSDRRSGSPKTAGEALPAGTGMEVKRSAAGDGDGAGVGYEVETAGSGSFGEGAMVPEAKKARVY